MEDIHIALIKYCLIRMYKHKYERNNFWLLDAFRVIMAHYTVLANRRQAVYCCSKENKK